LLWFFQKVSTTGFGLRISGGGWGGLGEAELVEQELVNLLGLGVAFHSHFATVGGGDGHIEHLQ
jgi:hypothetical protein